MIKLKVGMVSLGCDKNRVDSEIILDQLNGKYEIVTDPQKADIIIINTCGFIESSKQESIDTILEMAKYKVNYNCKMLVVTGCLVQRYKDEILKLMPEIDIILGVNDYDKLLSSIEDSLEHNKKISHCSYSDSNINTGSRFLTTNKGTAYIRIAEGCSNYCTYCIIPKIRGKYRSRDMSSILQEAHVLVSQGVKEIILIAQDTTKYGIDLYGEKKLPFLINELSKISGIEWIRLLYCYPEGIDDALINEMAENSKVCKYIDMPIQHISNKILRMMNRRDKKDEISDCILKLRERIPNICIRTSLIVGFPGEEEQDYNELKAFVQEIKFDKLGVFKYSQEEDTAAALMPNQVDDETKIAREEELMLLQQKISNDINAKKVGNTYEVLIEGFDGEMWYGRSYEMSPEIDGAIFFKCDKILNVGEFQKVKIIRSLEYDLIGVV